MSIKIAVLLTLAFVGSAYLGIFLGSIDHENKMIVNVSPSISQPIQHNQNPSEKGSQPIQNNNAPSSPVKISPSFQNSNGTHTPSSPAKVSPSFQHSNSTR